MPTSEQCGDHLPGLYEGVILVCQREQGHSGRHQDAQLGEAIEWSDESWRYIGVRA
jgi:hypothetical protein